MFRDMKLGRIGRPLPPGVPSLREHAVAGMVAPARLLRDDVEYRPAMDGNDAVGDCTCAAVSNAIRAQAALRGYQVAIPTGRVLDLYRAVSGYDPARPATDTGAFEVDVLTYQVRHGFATGGQTPYVGLWANIGPGDLNLVRLAMAQLGSVYLGIDLALADQQGDVWDTGMPASYGDPTPGSWGSHAVLGWAYSGLEDTDLVQMVTWGRLQPATWRWFRSRVTEAHALFHPQMEGDLTGIDLDALRGELAEFSA